MKKTIYLSDLSSNLLLPLYEFGLSAGFPSPAQDYAASSIDLNVALLVDRENTCFIQVQDNDLEEVNIFDGDLAILATDIAAHQGNKIVCYLNGEYLNRIVEIDRTDQSFLLLSTNPKIGSIKINENSNCIVKGVITYTITSHVPGQLYLDSENTATIDINKLLIKNRASTFLGLIKGNSMQEAGILDGDLAIIDKSLQYIDGYKALCQIRDQFTIKFLKWDKKEKELLWLKPANKDFPAIKVQEEESVKVWGIVTHTITPHIRKFNL